MKPIFHLSLPCPPIALTQLLRLGAEEPHFYFESRQSPVALAGLGIAAQQVGQGERRFASLGAALPNLLARLEILDPSLPPPVTLAGGAFFPRPRPSKWDSFPPAALLLPRVTLTRQQGQTFLGLNAPAREAETRSEAQTRLRREALSLLEKLSSLSPAPSLNSEVLSLEESDPAAWEAMLKQAIRSIEAGKMQKVVLARVTRARLRPTPEAPAWLERLGQACPDCFRFLFAFRPGQAFLGATPERLISLRAGEFCTSALAGSIRRGVTTAEDESLAEELLASLKDQREHAFVREQICAALQPLAENLEVDAQPQILRLPNIQHLRTRISGRLRPGINALEVVQALHPTPAVGGTPGAAAQAFLRQQEGFERGWYAAPLGWLTPNGEGDFAVAIRSALLCGEELSLFGGAGIVAASDPRKEWEETGLKMRFLLEALQAALV